MLVDNRSSRALLCLVQSLMLLSPLPALAVASSADSQRVARFEEILFGRARTSGSLDSRVKNVEANLWGSARSGALSQRLDAIARVLGQQEPRQLLPPVAPRLDTTGSAAVQPAPETARRSADESYGAPSPSAGPSDEVKDLLREAIQAYGSGSTAQAEKMFRQVLNKDPGNADAHYNLGAIAEGRGQLEEARKHYQKALEDNPNDTELREALASVEQNLEQRRQAEASAQADKQAKQSQQKQRDKLRRLADNAAAAYRNHNYDEAIGNLQAIERQAPNDAEVQFGLGQAWRGKGDLNRARAYLARAASLDPGNALYSRTAAEVDRQAREQQIASARPDERSPGQIRQLEDGEERLPRRSRQWEEQDDTPPGKLTPFENVDDESPYQRFGSGGGLGSLARFLPSFSMGAPYGSYYYRPTMSYRDYEYRASGGSRLKRAATGALAGAALGAFMGRGTEGGVKSGAIQGAIFGGMAGLLFGGF